MRTFTPPTRIPLRRSELRRDTPLEAVVESFFVSEYDLSPRTVEWYRTQFSGFIRFLREGTGREPVMEDLNADYVTAFLSKIAKEPTAKYPKGSPFRPFAAATVLKRLGHWLAKDGLYTDKFGRSVLNGVKKGDVPEDVRQPPSDDQWEAIREAAGRSGERDHALVVFLAGTGLRFNEVRELRVQDVDVPGGMVTVRAETSKFKKARVTHFHPAVSKELDRFLRQRPVLRPEDPLFPTDEGTFFSPHGFDKVFRRIRERSGVQEFSAHTLRHHFATHFDGDLMQLRDEGGWKNMEMVERYRHNRPLKDRSMLPDPTGERPGSRERLRPARVYDLDRRVG